jgi:uncharacterized protein YdaU (DUF1376 family)
VHYYQFNIGDYKTHTAHLTPIEDICYRRLLDHYYLHEKPIFNDIEKITRLLMLNGYSTDVEHVLNEYFKLVEQYWHNVRADAEISIYHAQKESKSKAGKASAAKRSRQIEQPSNTCSTDVQLNKKQETRTNINTPLTMLVNMGVEESLARDWIKVRKEKKQATTQTALDRIKSHAEKNGYTFSQAVKIACENAWAGFNVKWIDSNENKEVKPDWLKV